MHPFQQLQKTLYYGFYYLKINFPFEIYRIQNFKRPETGRNLGGLLSHMHHFSDEKMETEDRKKNVPRGPELSSRAGIQKQVLLIPKLSIFLLPKDHSSMA